MGVLTHRLHGSVTALAAMVAFYASSDLLDKSGLRSLLCATGRTLLLPSEYGPTTRSPSYMHISPLNSSSSSMGSAAFEHPPLCSPIHVTQGSPFASQTSSLRFYRALSTASAGQRNLLQRVIIPAQEGHHGVNLLFMDNKSSPLMVIDAIPVHPSPLESIAHVRLPHWTYLFTVQCLHPRISAHHSMAANFSVPRFPHMAHLEKLSSLVYGAHAIPPMASASLLHMWHCPFNRFETDGDGKKVAKGKPSVTVVLLGWLGAEQRHLKKYADWYTSQGIHAITFVVPMKDLLTLKAGDKAEQHVDVLTRNLVQWLKEDVKEGNEKMVIFHTFSNTGWLVYGAVLEKLISQEDDLLERIKGCVVDSAPSARPDPRIWASGFSAALLKKGSMATRMLQPYGAEDWNGVLAYPKPSFKETALLAMLEKFFSVFLQIPYVNRRLNDVVSVLAKQQPACPQLYIYSSADAVIPAKSVESFIEEQRKAGHIVKACNFQFSPHVDHFRTFPERYIEQLTSFLKLCVPQWAAR